ncbi:hypothetical protein JCM10213_005988 [Rhodosporidiobolus nylandii]
MRAALVGRVEQAEGVPSGLVVPLSLAPLNPLSPSFTPSFAPTTPAFLSPALPSTIVDPTDPSSHLPWSPPLGPTSPTLPPPSPISTSAPANNPLIPSSGPPYLSVEQLDRPFDEVEHLRAKVARAEKVEKAYDDKLKRVRAERSATRVDNARLTKRLAKTEVEKDVLVAELAEAGEENARLVKLLAKAHAEKKDLADELDEADEALEHAEERLEAVEQEKVGLEELAAAERQAASVAAADLALCQSQRDALKERVRDLEVGQVLVQDKSREKALLLEEDLAHSRSTTTYLFSLLDLSTRLNAYRRVVVDEWRRNAGVLRLLDELVPPRSLPGAHRSVSSLTLSELLELFDSLVKPRAADDV